jgi:hypothetical protein
MAGYYVVFQGTKPRIYRTWSEATKHVLGVKYSVHKKYATYDEALAAYQESLRDFHALVGAPQPLALPHVPHVDAMPPIPPADGKTTGGKVLLIITVVVFLFALWLEAKKSGHHCCPS